MPDRFPSRLKSHGAGGEQIPCPKNCGECCYDRGEKCRNLGDEGCLLPVQERPVVCNRYLCPDQTDDTWRIDSIEHGVKIVLADSPPFPPPAHRIQVREAMARWEAHRVHDVPEGCPPGSTFGSAFLTNVRDWDEETVWGMNNSRSLCHILVLGGGPSAIQPNTRIFRDFGLPNLVLATRDYLKAWWPILKRMNVCAVDGELDMLGHVRDYPDTYDGGLICDPCKLLDPEMLFAFMRFVRLPPMQREDTFYKPPWLGREAPYRTSGELALWIALYVLRAPVVGVLGIENEGPARVREYENAMALLTGGHESEIMDYSGRGAVADYLEGKK